jgi:hypothetical protein
MYHNHLLVLLMASHDKKIFQIDTPHCPTTSELAVHPAKTMNALSKQASNLSSIEPGKEAVVP